ncbi:hypothetical protein BDY19DRAFT_692840 [Irpex rosettiformis]|uniref:Uncharacterized protein n=1 Tax=Irpex rosettiformis TaxID=378272 RepID=A0ACB8UAI6_9APHY|nr:hypothetical protein BDY19DRAFT_692840 [Irpex rosettiformis]
MSNHTISSALAQLPTEPCPLHDPQVDSTAVHPGPLTLEGPRDLLPVSVEDTIAVHDTSFLRALTSQFNSNIFVSAVMFGPLNTMRMMPDISHNVILRPMSTIALITDTAALICALIIRIRLYYLKRRGREDDFGQVSGLISVSSFPGSSPLSSLNSRTN